MPIRIFNKVKDILEDKDMEAMEKEFTLLSILCDVPYDELLSYTIEDVRNVYNQLDFLSNFDQGKVDVKYKKIKINDKTYKVNANVNEFNVAQYIDFQNYIKGGNKYVGEMLSVFLIPEGKKYNEDYDIVETINDIYDYLPITTANSLLFFFIKSLTRSINRTLTYWGLATMVMTKNKKKQIMPLITKMKETHGYLLSILSQK